MAIAAIRTVVTASTMLTAFFMVLAGLFSSFPLLSDDQSARRRQQHHRNQAFALELERRFADDLQMRAGVVHQDEPVRIHLRQKSANFLLTNRHVAVAEQQVNRALDL